MKVLAVVVLGLAAVSLQAQYTVTELTPDGYSNRANISVTGASGGQQVGYASLDGGLATHALLWSSMADTVIDLHPDGFDRTQALAIGDGEQVGWGQIGAIQRCLLWSGDPATVVDLTPDGLDLCRPTGVSGGEQVGFGSGALFNGAEHALLWADSPDSLVDLHPDGYTNTEARGIGDGQQVGVGFLPGTTHALLWLGTADSVVDLHPGPGFANSSARAAKGGQQVGAGELVGAAHPTHALLWTGTPDSLVDLTPDLQIAEAVATNGVQQVGGGFSIGPGHALVWSGTPDSVVDLHAWLPPECTNSEATGIDEFGNIAGYAYCNAFTEIRLYLWQPTGGAARE